MPLMNVCLNSLRLIVPTYDSLCNITFSKFTALAHCNTMIQLRYDCPTLHKRSTNNHWTVYVACVCLCVCARTRMRARVFVRAYVLACVLRTFVCAFVCARVSVFVQLQI